MSHEEEKTIAILTRIRDLNREKADAARIANDAMNKIAEVSAQIGELAAGLKEPIPCPN